VIISKSTTFYYNPQKDSNGKRCCKRNVVAEVLALAKIVDLFVAQSSFYSLFHF
jgi:hypothetical protein